MVYPIEDLWGILKNRVKRRNPKNIEELTIFMFEEWNSVPQTLINNLFKNFIKRIKKVLELDGARLENEHLKQIKGREGEYGEEHEWKKKDFKILRIYNDEQLLKLKNKEIAGLKKILNTIPKKYKKKLVKLSNKNPDLGKRIGFITLYQKKKKKLLNTKRKNQEELKELIKKIEKMNLEDYLRHINEENKEEENEEENEEDDEEDDEENKDDTTVESIKNILELKEIQDKDKDIQYNTVF